MGTNIRVKERKMAHPYSKLGLPKLNTTQALPLIAIRLQSHKGTLGPEPDLHYRLDEIKAPAGWLSA